MTHRLRRPARLLATAVLGPLVVLGLVASGAPVQGAPPSLRAPDPGSLDTDCPVASDDVVGGQGSSSGGDPYFPPDGNGGYDVRSYTIDLTYRPATDRLRGTTVVALTPRADLQRLNLDLVLPVDSVRVGGTAAEVSRTSKHEIQVTPAEPLGAGETARVRVSYHGRPSRHVAETMSPDEDLYFHAPGETIAMGEPQNGAWWFPANETPADTATFDLTVRVPAGDQVVSNGARTSQSTAGRWTTRQWRTTTPITTYQAFFAAGDFQVHRGVTDGRRYTYAVSRRLGSGARAAAFTFLERTPRIVSWLEDHFGPYPYGSVGGVVTGLRAPYALETATRPVYPYVGSGGTLLAVHENAHQWFGDTVSLCRWKDVWLNEGFATYAEWLWAADHDGLTVDEKLHEAYDARSGSDSWWHVLPGDPGPDDMWGPQVYQRGAMTLAALRHRIGGADFETLLRQWVQEHAGGHGTGTEFRALAEEVSGQDLGSFFTAWLDTGAKPAATVENGLA